MTYLSRHIALSDAELHVTEWGDKANPALIMWHGLARTGRDFDEAAAALSERFFVICPDTVGRGLSSWAKNPLLDYTYDAYARHALELVDHYGLDRMRWVGTSMGGLLGMVVGTCALASRISHLVINDVGPELPAAGLNRIVDYVGNPPVRDTAGEMEAWFRNAYAPFGDNSDAFWKRMTDTSIRRRDDGRWTVHYDPEIVAPLRETTTDTNLWPLYDGLSMPVCILRGERSDILPAATAEAMTKRGPKAQLHVIEGCGHAPTLASSREIDVLRAFLD